MTKNSRLVLVGRTKKTDSRPDINRRYASQLSWALRITILVSRHEKIIVHNSMDDQKTTCYILQSQSLNRTKLRKYNNIQQQHAIRTDNTQALLLDRTKSIDICDKFRPWTKDEVRSRHRWANGEEHNTRETVENISGLLSGHSYHRSTRGVRGLTTPPPPYPQRRKIFWETG